MAAGLSEGRRSEAIMCLTLSGRRNDMGICPRKFVRSGVFELDGSPCCVPGCITCTQFAHRVRNFGQVAWELWAAGEHQPLHASMLASNASDNAVMIAHTKSAVHLVFMLSDQSFRGQIRLGQDQEAFKAACKYANCRSSSCAVRCVQNMASSLKSSCDISVCHLFVLVQVQQMR